MKSLIIHTVLFCLSLCFILTIGQAVSNSIDTSLPQQQNSQKTYIAGEKIILSFSPLLKPTDFLHCSSSYGSAIIFPTNKDGISKFIVPEFLARSTGFVNWELVSDDLLTSGTFQILPDAQNQTFLETYLGPQQIFAGGNDYAMMTAIPVDQFDNPLQDSTALLFNTQFENDNRQFSILTKNMIAWKQLFSTEKMGRILTTVQTPTSFSKEKAIEVYPFIPQNFKIFVNRHHDFADGNQIAELRTSIITDKFNNIIADGTLVDFLITDQDGYKLKISASTINGIATGKLLHPEAPANFTIKAYIHGVAESESITLPFKAAVADFDIQLTHNNFHIYVGPIKSFMNQLVPDGLRVTLECYRKNALILKDQKTTVEGQTNWSLNPVYFPEGIDEIRITAAGIEKHYKLKNPQ
ncbi:hypothetical protein ACJD0Z_02655 [Flavobacteriaceae bacterium M23B6Z8]